MSLRFSLLISWLVLGAALVPGRVAAQALLPPPPPAAAPAEPGLAMPSQTASDDSVRYALVVGTNQGGPGQVTLRYAEDDAGRVADVLTTLAGVDAEHIERLLQPTAAELDAALDAVRVKLQAHADRGEPSRFFFYYSGHARADALNLGTELVPLSSLRERLLKLPSTVSIVVLDACQSGAISRVKGAEPAADFSWNSVRKLETEGVAVIASSTGQELSQESEELKSSYFTHHWLVGLRGAGDDNADGRVTLSEAYQYAYNRTLAATAVTTVGEQHVTLETSFKGKGELDLTQPSAADARLRVPASFAGHVLVQSLPSWSPLAELDKVAGEQPIDLALPPGRYATTLRMRSTALRCPLVLESGKLTTLTLTGCARVVAAPAIAKGALVPDVRAAHAASASTSPVARLAPHDGKEDEGWIFEALVGFRQGSAGEDAYTGRLTSFGYERVGVDNGRYVFTLGHRLLRNLAVGATFGNLGGEDYVRENGDVTQDFVWDAQKLGAYAQGDFPLGAYRLLNLFARGGVGLAFASTELDAIKVNSPFADASADVEGIAASTEKIEQSYLDYFLSLGAGVQINPSDYVGFTIEGSYVYSPVLENALGDTRDVACLNLMVGLRVRTWN